MEDEPLELIELGPETKVTHAQLLTFIMTSKLQYVPLDNPLIDIRLVTIEPGKKKAPIRCRIKEFTPMYVPKYRALSYVWGDNSNLVAITVNGENFMVTSNLAGALRSLRETSTRRAKLAWVWIDALCINQQDIAERDQQVRRMKSIYQNAYEVVVWLGDYDEPTDDTTSYSKSRWGIDNLEVCDKKMACSVLDLIEALSLINGFKLPYGSLAPEKYKQRVSHYMNLRLETITAQHWVQLSKLFGRPWFERLWVIQELGSSRNTKFRWGEVEGFWQTLERAASFIRSARLGR